MTLPTFRFLCWCPCCEQMFRTSDLDVQRCNLVPDEPQHYGEIHSFIDTNVVTNKIIILNQLVINFHFVNNMTTVSFMPRKFKRVLALKGIIKFKSKEHLEKKIRTYLTFQ